ncbi:MAG: CHASE2 domain-containing protein [Leptolyngbya sp. SIO1E4]|nr:CHASE2 domain-containing protein [Leptolyngbya sp. SIO1E4]
MANTPPHKAPKLMPWAQKCLNWVGRLGHPIVLSTITTSAVVFGIRAIGGLQGLELGVYDQMMRLRPALDPDERILVVGISEADVQSRREWPIQDSTLSEVLEVVLAGNPRAVGLDIFRDVPIGEGHEALLKQIQTNDQVVPVCKISSPDTPGVPPPSGTPETQVGFSDLVVDSGGILRRSLLLALPPEESGAVVDHLCSDPNAQLFSFSLQLALRYLAGEGINPELTPNQEIKLQETVLRRLDPHVGGYHNVEASGYQLLLNFRSARDAVPQVSLSEVLSGQVTPDQIRDRIVLIGATTPQAKDTFYTPYSGGLRDSQKMPGVIVHAQAVSQILSAVLEGRSLIWSWSSFSEGLWLIAWGLGGALFAWYVRRPICFALGAGVLLGGLYGASYLLFLQGGWVPIVPPALVLTLAAGGVVLLDRFNKSDYGKAVYKQMKSLLRLDIEIDTTRLGQQVAEITETEYFNSLQQQARQLRQQRESQSSQGKRVPKKELPRSTTPDPSENMDDYFDNLKREARRLKASDSDKSDSDKPDQKES